MWVKQMLVKDLMKVLEVGTKSKTRKSRNENGLRIDLVKEGRESRVQFLEDRARMPTPESSSSLERWTMDDRRWTKSKKVELEKECQLEQQNKFKGLETEKNKHHWY